MSPPAQRALGRAAALCDLCARPPVTTTQARNSQQVCSPHQAHSVGVPPHGRAGSMRTRLPRHHARCVSEADGGGGVPGGLARVPRSRGRRPRITVAPLQARPPRPLPASGPATLFGSSITASAKSINERTTPPLAVPRHHLSTVSPPQLPPPRCPLPHKSGAAPPCGGASER